MILPDGIQGGVSAEGNAAARSVRGRSCRAAGVPAQEAALAAMGGYGGRDCKALRLHAQRGGACVDVLGGRLIAGCAGAAVGIVAQGQRAGVDRTIGLGGVHVGDGGRGGAGRFCAVILPPSLEGEGPSVIGHGGEIGGDLRHGILMVLDRAGLGGAGTEAAGSQIIVGCGDSFRELLVVQVDRIALGNTGCTGVQIHRRGNIVGLAAGAAEGNLRNRGTAGVTGDIDIQIVAACIHVQVNGLVLAGVCLAAAAQQVGGDAIKDGGGGGITALADEDAGDRLAGICGGLVTHVDICRGRTTALIQVIVDDGIPLPGQDILGGAFLGAVGHGDARDVGRGGGIHFHLAPVAGGDLIFHGIRSLFGFLLGLLRGGLGGSFREFLSGDLGRFRFCHGGSCAFLAEEAACLLPLQIAACIGVGRVMDARFLLGRSRPDRNVLQHHDQRQQHAQYFLESLFISHRHFLLEGKSLKASPAANRQGWLQFLPYSYYNHILYR